MSRAAWPILFPAMLVVGASCARFGEEPSPSSAANDAGGDIGDVATNACAMDTCDGRGRSCRAYDFAKVCPDGWEFQGDPATRVTRECTSAGIHVAAKDTLDVIAGNAVEEPSELTVARVALRFTVTKWDSLALFQIGTTNTATAFEVTAIDTARGDMKLELCLSGAAGPTDCVSLATTSFAREHLLVAELDAQGISVSVDCGPTATRPGRAIEAKESLSVGFGHVQGDDFEGTLAAATFSFR